MIEIAEGRGGCSTGHPFSNFQTMAIRRMTCRIARRVIQQKSERLEHEEPGALDQAKR